MTLMKMISGKLTKIFICFSKHKTAAFKAAVLYFRDKISFDLTVVCLIDIRADTCTTTDYQI